MKPIDFLPMLLGGTVTSAIVVTTAIPSTAMSGSEVNDIARDVTVLVNGGAPGSGVIISRDGNTYYVLTAKHVVANEGEYIIVTSDQEAHGTSFENVVQFSGADLAVVSFESDESYPVATLANSDHASEGNTVFVSGWPYPGTGIQERIRQFTTGEVSARPEQALTDGYQMVYTNETRVGMSGGPVFDTSGRVVGIHGRADGEQIDSAQVQQLEQAGAGGLISNASRTGFNLGIPINTFLQQATQHGLYLSLDVENSAPQSLSSPYVTSGEVDDRDRIDNLNDTLGTINNVVDTIQNIRGVFPF